ncbi:MAG: MBL fold metallo-hydrolase [Myxococcota bacterium]
MLIAIASLVGGVLLLLVATTSFRALGSSPTGERVVRIQASPQYAEGRFHNMLRTRDDVPSNAGGFLPLLDRMLLSTPEVRRPTDAIPIVERVRADFEPLRATDFRATWLGHSTVLLELDGLRVLTDPMWSERASPNRLIGPRRFHPPPLPLAEVPAIDAVVISHSHYDHLDMNSVLAVRLAHFFVPLGVGAILEGWGIPAAQVHELDWWESTRFRGVEFVATPARHTSNRSLSDEAKTLWASWSIVGATARVFFSGDTGMAPFFADIGARYGPFDLTLIESGCYDRWWADLHLGPEQAVAVHRAVRGRVMLPIHWATFNQAPHAWTEPAERVRVEAARTLVLPRPGETIEPNAPPPVDPWWPTIPWSPVEETPIVSGGLR